MSAGRIHAVGEPARPDSSGPAVWWRCRLKKCGMKLFAALRPTQAQRKCENCGRVGFERLPGPSPTKRLRELEGKARRRLERKFRRRRRP